MQHEPAIHQQTLQPILQLRDVVRTYHQGSREVSVLRGVNGAIQSGEIVAMVAPSGAGKSTLLHMAGLLERPDAGSIIVNGVECSTLNDGERTAMRRRDIGFVYQFHQLLPEFTALENVCMPQLVLGRTKPAAKERARELLRMMGLEGRVHHLPSEMSGGEQQRVAIARAVANGPSLLLADEPTGNLDPETADRVFAQLIQLVRSTRLGALIATHNLELAHRMDRVVTLQDGKLVPFAK